MSGHSKWSQIKHKKALTDAKRGKIFSKLAKEISVAARVGGESPEMNIRLRAALERAKSAGLPKDNIERAIQKSAGEGAVENLQEFLYEALGPGEVSILIEGITDNKNRSLNEIKIILGNTGGKLAEQGSLSWNFEKIGLIELAPLTEDQEKKFEEIIINSGANDFYKIDLSWLVETSFSETEKVRRVLETSGLAVKESGHDFKPKSYLEIPAEDKKSLENLLESLLDQDDVREVYTNIKE